MTGLSGEAEAYLRQLKLSLSSIPETERDDILAETRAHVSEMTGRGVTVEETLNQLGPAQVYARAFLQERELASALASQGSFAMLGVVVRRASTNAVAFVAVLLTAFMAMVVFVSIGMVCLKLTDPKHAGLWLSETEFFVGVIDDPATARELLGNWIFIAASAVIILAWLAGRGLLAWALRSLHGARS